MRTGAELDPQFRIATPDGDWWIGIALSPGMAERQRQLGLVSRLMAGGQHWASYLIVTTTLPTLRLVSTRACASAIRSSG